MRCWGEDRPLWLFWQVRPALLTNYNVNGVPALALLSGISQWCPDPCLSPGLGLGSVAPVLAHEHPACLQHCPSSAAPPQNASNHQGDRNFLGIGLQGLHTAWQRQFLADEPQTCHFSPFQELVFLRLLAWAASLDRKGLLISLGKRPLCHYQFNPDCLSHYTALSNPPVHCLCWKGCPGTASAPCPARPPACSPSPPHLSRPFSSPLPLCVQGHPNFTTLSFNFSPLHFPPSVTNQ